MLIKGFVVSLSWPELTLHNSFVERDREWGCGYGWAEVGTAHPKKLSAYPKKTGVKKNPAYSYVERSETGNSLSRSSVSCVDRQ